MRNVLGTKLQQCKGEHDTGFHRDNYCQSGKDDEGSHHICIKNVGEKNGEFCTLTRQPNWCKKYNQPWCVCQWAYDEASSAKCPPIDCEATSELAIQQYPHDSAGRRCIRDQCLV